MTLTMFVASLLVVSVAAQASGHHLQTQSSPAFLIVGTKNGEITRCLYDSPENCELIHVGEKGNVYSTVIHGKYLYAALQPNKILRCEWDRMNSCEVYYKAKDQIFTLTVSDGYLYAGGGYPTGLVLLCELNRPNSCFLLEKFPDQVVNIFELNNHIYIATSKSILCCSKGAKLQCLNVRVDKNLGRLISVSHIGNIITTLRLYDDDVSYYKLVAGDSLVYIQKKEVNIPHGTHKFSVFKKKLYVLKISGDIEMSEDYRYVFNESCRWCDQDFKKFARLVNAFSISFGYATHHMHHNAYGVGKCFEPSSSSVFSYGVEHRALLEALVVGGRLQDARGAALDTRRADRGRAGPAAVFAMGPGGQLLLSRAHSSGLVHVSSLFAGLPVAGAGEIVVEDGVVKRIIACSVAYWPDIELNKQVVDELYRRGYDKADDIKLETCDYTCDRN